MSVDCGSHLESGKFWKVCLRHWFPLLLADPYSFPSSFLIGLDFVTLMLWNTDGFRWSPNLYFWFVQIPVSLKLPFFGTIKNSPFWLFGIDTSESSDRCPCLLVILFGCQVHSALLFQMYCSWRDQLQKKGFKRNCKHLIKTQTPKGDQLASTFFIYI